MIQFTHVSKTYLTPTGQLQALKPLSLDIRPGEIFGIIGQSGAGKSTLLRMINGLEKPSQGQVQVEGQDVAALPGPQLRALRRRVGMIFQHFNLLSSQTVADNVAFPLRLAGADRATVQRRVAELLERVGLRDFADRYPAQLSGGQKQRVGIARALATQPTLLLCDEATSALDPHTTQSILRLLAELNRELGLTIVLITHEMEVVRRICHRVAVLDAGELVESGPVEQVFLHPQHATTQQFVADAEHLDDEEQLSALEAVSGRILRLTFLGADTFKPLLGQVARQTGVDYTILGGHIGRIRDTPYGQLTIALTGGDIEGAQAALVQADVHVQELRR